MRKMLILMIMIVHTYHFRKLHGEASACGAWLPKPTTSVVLQRQYQNLAGVHTKQGRVGHAACLVSLVIAKRTHRFRFCSVKTNH